MTLEDDVRKVKEKQWNLYDSRLQESTREDKDVQIEL